MNTTPSPFHHLTMKIIEDVHGGRPGIPLHSLFHQRGRQSLQLVGATLLPVREHPESVVCFTAQKFKRSKNLASRTPTLILIRTTLKGWGWTLRDYPPTDQARLPRKTDRVNCGRLEVLLTCHRQRLTTGWHIANHICTIG